MTHRGLLPYGLALIAAGIALAYVTLVRLPLPFAGFAAMVAAGLAALLTLAMCAALPARALFSDADLLRHAFKSRHNLSDDRAAGALEALARAHGRAELIRQAASGFVEDLQTRALRAADSLDLAARHLYYQPERLPSLRAPILRSELVEEAVLAHKALRTKGSTERHAQSSRDKLGPALDALEAAFEQANASFEGQMLLQVEAASATAETLLAPRRRISS